MRVGVSPNWRKVHFLEMLYHVTLVKITVQNWKEKSELYLLASVAFLKFKTENLYFVYITTGNGKP